MMNDEHQSAEPEVTDADAEAAPAMQAEENAEMELLRAENADVKDRLLRLAADMENLRRRTARDVHDARAFSISGFAREMLVVADNLDRALKSVGEDAKSEDGDLKILVEGVELTERSMLSSLEKHGVKRIIPKGEKFDPNYHQAMFEVPNTDLPNNTVIEVVQPGFVIGDRVLRPAMVGVSKGGPKELPPEPGAPNAEAEKDA